MLIMKITFNLLLSLFLITMWQVQVAAQNPNDTKNWLKFDHVFDVGVPTEQSFLQDNDGFLWFGTWGGVSGLIDGNQSIPTRCLFFG